eukprot:TRINITY_DN8780_c0_g2_i3.p1 TRINITY_DN8780_c0_g2~~TRINITY_DN8780_c0_g2_i3.p1  ORF type:complete len:357 (+),score=97.02 TRINITY_DN8780_c0_g2_i3:230-1300(+)
MLSLETLRVPRATGIAGLGRPVLGNLVSLALPYAVITDEELRYMATVCLRLRRLHVSRPTRLTDGCVPTLADWTALESLTFDAGPGCRLSKPALAVVAALCRRPWDGLSDGARADLSATHDALGLHELGLSDSDPAEFCVGNRYYRTVKERYVERADPPPGSPAHPAVQPLRPSSAQDWSWTTSAHPNPGSPFWDFLWAPRGPVPGSPAGVDRFTQLSTGPPSSPARVALKASFAVAAAREAVLQAAFAAAADREAALKAIAAAAERYTALCTDEVPRSPAVAHVNPPGTPADAAANAQAAERYTPLDDTPVLTANPPGTPAHAITKAPSAQDLAGSALKESMSVTPSVPATSPFL